MGACAPQNADHGAITLMASRLVEASRRQGTHQNEGVADRPVIDIRVMNRNRIADTGIPEGSETLDQAQRATRAGMPTGKRVCSRDRTCLPNTGRHDLQRIGVPGTDARTQPRDRPGTRGSRAERHETDLVKSLRENGEQGRRLKELPVRGVRLGKSRRRQPASEAPLPGVAVQPAVGFRTRKSGQIAPTKSEPRMVMHRNTGVHAQTGQRGQTPGIGETGSGTAESLLQGQQVIRQLKAGRRKIQAVELRTTPDAV